MVRLLVGAVLLTIAALIGGAALLHLGSDPHSTSEEEPAEHSPAGRWIENGAEAVRLAEAGPSAPHRSPVKPSLSPRELDRAIRRLVALQADSPGDPSTRSDLANALLARAKVTGQAVDLIQAVAELEGAIVGAPRRQEVLYNRALALTRLHLRAAAREAWESYLHVDPTSSWSEAARLLLSELQEPTLLERWENGGQDSLLRSSRSGRVEEVAERLAAYRSFARVWIEEQLLPEWAEAAAQGPTGEATRQLETIRILGQALAESTHDRTVTATLARMDALSPKDQGLLLDGLRLYGQGMASYRGFGSEQETDELLDKAERALKQTSSPLWGWARFYRAVGWHRSRPEYARARLTELAAVTSADRQPILLARTEWLLGTNEVTQNRYERSLVHYQRARELLEFAVGPEAAAFVDLLIAEALSKLGEVDAAWVARLTAIEGVSTLGEPQLLHAALYSAIEQLFLEGRSSAAHPFVMELANNADRWGAAPALAEAALQEGRFHAGEGRLGESTVCFRRAWEAAARIGGESMRRRTEATIALYQAESGLDATTDRGEGALELARTEMLELGYRFQLPRLDAARAAISLEQGDREAAVAALRSSITEEERIRREIHDVSMRVSAFEGAQRAFDMLVQLELDRPDGDARAFDWTEQGRARALLDLLADSGSIVPKLGRPVGLENLSAAMPAQTDLLEFVVLPERLVFWLVRREGIQRFETRIAARDLESLVARLRNAVEHGSHEATVREAGGELWTVLLGPARRELRVGRSLVFVPDRFLGSVPFAALFDPERQSYLVEDHSITIAPSATVYLVVREHRTAMIGGPPASVLAIGANHPAHLQLPWVGSEAEEIGALYPRPNVLTGDDATRARFLEAIARAEVVHFAGHGKDDVMAFTRSRLYFRPGEPDDPGVLFSHEISDINLTQTSVAVLAACRSVAPSLRGRESVSGLAAAFLAAGVPTVVASLWEAEDQATRAVMTAFHRNLRTGEPPSNALRLAQLDLAHSKTPHREPRYWAGFVAVGAN